jgi:hypothetical protein
MGGCVVALGEVMGDGEALWLTAAGDFPRGNQFRAFYQPKRQKPKIVLKDFRQPTL